MKQHLQTVEYTSAGGFEKEVNELLNQGYIVKSTLISKRWANTPEEYSIYQAILIKETE